MLIVAVYAIWKSLRLMPNVGAHRPRSLGATFAQAKGVTRQVVRCSALLYGWDAEADTEGETTSDPLAET